MRMKKVNSGYIQLLQKSGRNSGFLKIVEKKPI